MFWCVTPPAPMAGDQSHSTFDNHCDGSIVR
jgi:hypothetical protein